MLAFFVCYFVSLCVFSATYYCKFFLIFFASGEESLSMLLVLWWKQKKKRSVKNGERRERDNVWFDFATIMLLYVVQTKSTFCANSVIGSGFIHHRRRRVQHCPGGIFEDLFLSLSCYARGKCFRRIRHVIAGFIIVDEDVCYYWPGGVF